MQDYSSRGGSRHSQHSQLRMSDFPSLIIPIIMLKVMNELRFKTQDKHIFIYYVFKVFISTPSLYSIYFTPFCLCETFLDLLRWKTTFSFIEPSTQESQKRPRRVLYLGMIFRKFIDCCHAFWEVPSHF